MTHGGANEAEIATKCAALTLRMLPDAARDGARMS